ncbi:DUF2971 domain-containing protein [Vibrio splendidus]|uniref:SEL1-like repeat protein n=1 Tax=Vibrio splendidus TaxID=29497 RepID=UPI00352D1D96
MIKDDTHNMAELDDGDILFNTALKYEFGKGVEQSFEKAIEYYLAAAELGHSDAMFNLAISYERGEGVEKSLEKAIEYYKKAIELDHSNATFNLAIKYEFGKGVEKSPEIAFEYYQKAAELGHSNAMFYMAVSYEHGEGVERSIEKAFEYYQKAADLGSANAMFNLAISYQNSEGTEQSWDKAIEYYCKAAELGHSNAAFNLALKYELGHGVEQSFEKATEYYQMGAELGHSKATFNLAVCYERGEGVEQSFDKAVEYYLKAAELGHTNAMFNLAISYERGEGVEQSYEKAFEYYQQASALDNRKAMFNLALLTRRGLGCEKSQTKSEELFQNLYDLGDKSALRYLPHPSLRKYVYPALTKECSNNGIEEDVKRAFSQLQEAVIDIMESCEYKENKPIYHFTRWPAIQSILPKKPSESSRNVIRLYHEDYMNDPSEGKSLDMIIQSGKLDSKFHEVANFMNEALEQRSSLTQDASTYMASFTKSSDRLDLWRAYGSDGDGFCLKINITQTVGHIWSQAKFDADADADKDNVGEKNHLYKLYNVQYKQHEKQEKLEELLAALKPLHEIATTLSEVVQKEIKKTIFYMLGEVVYLFKDEQYSSEKEVRMFQRLSLNEVCIDESEIGKLYKPTGPILFTGEDSEIIIGPKVEKPRVAELSLRKRLQVNGFYKTKVTHSKVKYR